jgi:hypothetical protein
MKSLVPRRECHRALSIIIQPKDRSYPLLLYFIQNIIMDLPMCPNLLSTTSNKTTAKPSQLYYESFLQSTAKNIDKYIDKQDEAASLPCGRCKQFHTGKRSADGRHGKSKDGSGERGKCA